MLDPLGTKEVNSMIAKIKGELNKTIVVITHNLSEASFADRVIVLNNGNIVADGKPLDVFKNISILEESGLKTTTAISVIKDLKNKNYKNKKEIEEALWQLSYKM